MTPSSLTAKKVEDLLDRDRKRVALASAALLGRADPDDLLEAAMQEAEAVMDPESGALVDIHPEEEMRRYARDRYAVTSAQRCLAWGEEAEAAAAGGRRDEVSRSVMQMTSLVANALERRLLGRGTRPNR